jgi:hypothetical protein
MEYSEWSVSHTCRFGESCRYLHSSSTSGSISGSGGGNGGGGHSRAASNVSDNKSSRQPTPIGAHHSHHPSTIVCGYHL